MNTVSINSLFIPLVFIVASHLRAEPQKDNAPIVLPGIGVKGCGIGGSVRDASDVFGKPSKDDDQFADQGVELSSKEGKISVLFFHYFSPDHRPFTGKTDKGIGPKSTMEDVIKAYGKPDRVGESTVSEYEAYPGAIEHYLPYEKLGIDFCFYDKKLGNIRVYAKKDK